MERILSGAGAYFEQVDGGFRLVAGDRILLAHGPDHPAVGMAAGDAQVKMYRGNFAISDKPAILPVGGFVKIAPDHVQFSESPNGMIRLELRLRQESDRLLLDMISSVSACDRLVVNIPATSDEHIWGGGEQMSYLNLRGRAFPVWTSEPGVGRDKSRELTRIMDDEGMAGGDYWTTNYPQATFLSSGNYACHVDSSAYCLMDFTDDNRHRLEIWEPATTLEFYFADRPAALVSMLSDRFGRQPALPDWAVSGAIIGLKDGNRSFERLENIRKAGAAVSGLWCEDWVGIRQTSFGRRLFWNWSWNPDRYARLPEEIARLDAGGVRFLGYVNPYLAVDGPQFAIARDRGFLALQMDDDAPYIVDFGEFDCGIVDFTNEAALTWFAEDIIGREMLDFGLSGWMADFGEYLPVDLRLHDGSDPMLAHNDWPRLWAKVNARALESRNKKGEALFFMRAGGPGVQAYCPLLWAGDQCVDFSRHDGIGTTITAALSAGLVGNAYSHSDVGGYTSLHGVVRTPEILMRWAELGAFTPVMRTHEGNRPDDNLQIDSDADILAHFAAMSRVHAALAPYVRHLSQEAVETGLPLQRALFLHYPDETACLSCQDQYLYGADLMVAPIIEEGAMQREFFLPKGDDWIHIWSGQEYGPGQHKVAAGFGEPPVFARVGSRFMPLFLSLTEARGKLAL